MSKTMLTEYCESCSHNKICNIKEQYIEFVKKVCNTYDESFFNNYTEKSDFDITVKCKHYLKQEETVKTILKEI